MSNDESDRVRDEAHRLLAGAAKTVADARYCWLVTEGVAGGVDARPMGCVARDLERNGWVLGFVTDGRSRKASEIRRVGEVALVFQRDSEDAFVKLSGAAVLCDAPDEVRRRWKSAYDPYFPTELDRANGIFVDVTIARMDLWIRGVTPEPFGLRATTLERDPQDGWRITTGKGDAR